MVPPIVQRVSGILRDLWQRIQQFKKSPPQLNIRKLMKRPKPKF